MPYFQQRSAKSRRRNPMKHFEKKILVAYLQPTKKALYDYVRPAGGEVAYHTALLSLTTTELFIKGLGMLHQFGEECIAKMFPLGLILGETPMSESHWPVHVSK